MEPSGRFGGPTCGLHPQRVFTSVLIHLNPQAHFPM